MSTRSVRHRRTHATQPERRPRAREVHPSTQRRIDRINRFDAMLTKVVGWSLIAVLVAAVVVALATS